MTKRKTLLLRLDPRLWDEIYAWAEQELRSVNGQIEFILRDAVSRRRNRPRESGESRGISGRIPSSEV